MLDGVWQLLAPNIGPVATLLVLANMFFVWSLVNKIAKLEKLVTERFPVQDVELQNVVKEITSVKETVSQLVRDIKDFGHIRERVAVLEYALLQLKADSLKQG